MESKTRRSAGTTQATKVSKPTQVDEDLVDVLLVEDDPSVLEMYRLKLELDGYRVNTALDGEEGLKKAGELTPDIIFLDIRLPKMDGLEVLRKLRAQEKTRDIPVIILSNYDEEDLVARGLRLGAHEYLIKARTTPTSLSEGIEDWLKE
jgi:DNA-binding response OmpR family regulator